MGMLDWLKGNPKGSDKIATSGSILIFDEIAHKDCYGAVERTFHRVTNLDGLINRVGQDNDPSRHHLIASCSLNGRHIPMLDCDNFENMEKAKARFEAKGLRHAIIESSPGRYWLFPDMSFCDFDSAFLTTSHLPCDKKYISYTKKQGVYFVRAEPRTSESQEGRRGYIPVFLHNDCVEPNVISFVRQLMDLFPDPRVLSVAMLKKEFNKNNVADRGY